MTCPICPHHNQTHCDHCHRAHRKHWEQPLDSATKTQILNHLNQSPLPADHHDPN